MTGRRGGRGRARSSPVIDPHEVTSRESPRGQELTPVVPVVTRHTATNSINRVPSNPGCVQHHGVAAGQTAGAAWRHLQLCARRSCVRNSPLRDHRVCGGDEQKDGYGIAREVVVRDVIGARVGAIVRCWQSPLAAPSSACPPARRRSHRLLSISGSPTTRAGPQRPSQHGPGGTGRSLPGSTARSRSRASLRRVPFSQPRTRSPELPEPEDGPGCGRRTGAHTFAGAAQRHLRSVRGGSMHTDMASRRFRAVAYKGYLKPLTPTLRVGRSQLAEEARLSLAVDLNALSERRTRGTVPRRGPSGAET
jgi:hypothetical protein